MIFESYGILKYSNFETRIIVEIEQDIVDYYIKLIPKYYYVSPQKYNAHITVVRSMFENPNKKFWNKYENEIVPFMYSNEIHKDSTYFYLRAWSEKIGIIREELGLKKYRFDDSKRNSYHITLGNIKNE